MGRKRKKRRQSHGSAWHWRQTDCWYYTMPVTKKRMGLFDDDGERTRGKENKEAAEVALAKEKLTWANTHDAFTIGNSQCLVARVCSDYVQYCEKGLLKGQISARVIATTQCAG